MKFARFVIALLAAYALAEYFTYANSVQSYALMTFPGTTLHELAHYTIALVTGGKPHGFNLIPSGNTLGSVLFYPDDRNAASVAMAPFLLMPLTFIFAALSARARILPAIGWFYLSACAWIACIPSTVDFHLAMEYPSSFVYAFFGFGAIAYGTYFLTKSMIFSKSK